MPYDKYFLRIITGVYTTSYTPLSFISVPCYNFQMKVNILNKSLLIAVFSICLLFISCFESNHAKEYFEMHGMNYPVDVSRLSLLGIEYSGIEKDEVLVEGAREFIEEGIIFAKSYFMKTGVKSIVPDAAALTVDKPVLFRNKDGEAGLMVRISAFGSGDPGNTLNMPVEWIGENKKLWKVENFAYFNRNELYNWQYGGLVFSK